MNNNYLMQRYVISLEYDIYKTYYCLHFSSRSEAFKMLGKLKRRLGDRYTLRVERLIGYTEPVHTERKKEGK